MVSLVLGAVVKVTRSWSRIEAKLETVIRDLELHAANERAERQEIVARHTRHIEGHEARLVLIERELVRIGGGG